MCTVNKSVHTKKVWKLIECTSYIFRKGKSAVEGDPKESWSGIETEAEVYTE